MDHSKKLIAMAQRNGVDILSLYKLLKLTPLSLHAILWRNAPIGCKTAIELETIYFGVAEDWVSEDKYSELHQMKLNDSRFNLT